MGMKDEIAKMLKGVRKLNLVDDCDRCDEEVELGSSFDSDKISVV